MAKNTVFNVLYTMLSLLFPLFTSMYVSRILMPDGIGQVSYAQNISSYFVTFATFGVPTYGIREIAKVRESQNLTNMVFSELFIINFISTMLSMSSFIILILFVPSFKNEYLLFLCSGMQILLNCLNIDWFYQGQENYVYIIVRSILIKLVSLCAVFLFVKTRDDYILYALIYSLAIGGNYVFNIIHVSKYVKFSFCNLNIRRHLLPLLLIAFSIFLSSIYSRVDVTMLGLMTTDADMGLYVNSHKIIEIVISVCTAVSAVFLPRLSYYYNNDKAKFHNLLDFGVRILGFISIPAAVGLFLLAPQVIELLYGKSFIKAAETVRIFTLLVIVKSFGNLLCYQLVMATGNEKKRIPAYLAAAIINIILNTLLIPVLLQNGAAIASVVSELIVNGYQFQKMRKEVDIPISRKAILQAAVSSLVMAAAMILILCFRLSLLVKCIAAIFVGGGTYLLVNYMLKNELVTKNIKTLFKEI